MILDNAVDHMEEYRDYIFDIDQTIKNAFDSLGSMLRRVRK